MRKLPKIIQGGMGVGVSSWQLARAVSLEGHLGVVSGTGINTVLLRRLQDGDSNGDMRRAIAAFPFQEFADEALELYYRPGGRNPGDPYKLAPMPSVKSGAFLQRLLALAGFVEVFLAKEGHDGLVGINLLEKIQVANLPILYGAMLAGVDCVLMGAGIPREIPGVLDRFANHESAMLEPSGARFDPCEAFPRQVHEPAKQALMRPSFLAIVSSATLATHLARKSSGSVQGFVIEGAAAGGHNAPPRGPLRLSDRGEPIYGEKDRADLEAIRALDLPFWLAGSFAAPGKLAHALELGACGIQVGSAFAFCDESGISPEHRRAVIAKWTNDHDQPQPIFTDPKASPTGFPFKVVPLEGTLSEPEIYEARPRKCDLGYLREIVKGPDGETIYRCPAEPQADYVRKGGKLEDTIGRKCLCNALMADIGLGQSRKTNDGVYHEPSLVTAGDDLSFLGHLMPKGRGTYSAADVIRYLTAG